MQAYDSVVHGDLLDHFSGWQGTRAVDTTLRDYITNQGTLEAAIASAALFWPAIVEDEGCFYLATRYERDDLESVRAHFANDKRRIENWVNGWALADFFRAQQFAGDPVLDDEELLGAFGRALQLFWSLRLKTLFPTRKFIVEVSDEIEGEDGLSITFYEAPNSD